MILSRSLSVLTGICLVYGAGAGVLLFSLQLLYPSLIAEFGWTEAQVTMPATIFLVVSGLLSPAAGFLTDRYKPRWVMAGGILTILLGLLIFPFISALWQMVAVYLLFAAGLTAGGMLPSMVIITKWFHRGRGRAIAVLLTAASAGGAVFPLLIKSGLAAGGWRTAVAYVGVATALATIVPLLLLVRDEPQGVAPGAATDEAEAPPQGSPVAPGPVTLSAILRSPEFFLLIFVSMVMWFCINAALHHQSIFFARDARIGADRLVMLFSLFFSSAIIGKLLFGYLSDVFKKEHILLLSVLNLAVGCVLLRAIGGGQLGLAYGYAVVFGIGFSGAFAMIQIMVAERYSGLHYGRILGLFVLMDTLAGALGIAVLGKMRTAFGSYLPAFDLMIGLCLCAAVCAAATMWLRARR